MGDVDVGRGGPTVDRHDASLDLCPCPRASSMARGHVQEDELDRGNGVPRGMQRRCERAWPRSWCSAETIPFSIATEEAVTWVRPWCAEEQESCKLWKVDGLRIDGDPQAAPWHSSECQTLPSHLPRPWKESQAFILSVSGP